MTASIRNNIGRTTPKQRPVTPISRTVERLQVLIALPSMKTLLQISSRASQNAAALLFDLGSVDIR
jgi:hypothetical protein